MSNLEQIFLQNTTVTINKYKNMVQKTVDQLDEEQLFFKYASEDNSIAMILKHLAGNMLSRWTNFRTEDGEKEWRNRDTEFEDDLKTKEDVMAYWNKGWNCFEEALRSIKPEELKNEIFIRGEACTIMSAVIRQLAHYASHIGQIVYLGKSIQNERWQSLSIPKGESKKFNANPESFWKK